jgi:flagellar hook-associated protein 2
MNTNSTSSIIQSITGSTTNRVAGLSSGIDTETLVNRLLSLEKQRTIDPLLQKKQQLEWQQESYRTINTKLLALNSSAFDMTLSTPYQAKTVSSSDDSVLTATAGANALAGSYSIQVISLAAGVTKESTPIYAEYVHSGGDKSFTLSSKKGSATITVNDGDTLSTIAEKINEQTTTSGVKAFFNSEQNKFYLLSADTGSNSRVEITDTDGFVSDTLNMDTTTQSGSDAKIKFNGGSELSFSSNQFTFNGMNLNLKQAGKTVNISVGTDIDGIVNKIKSFVEAYNNAISDISGRLSEKRYRDYKPLSDEQKEAMTDKQIEQWEAKAKSGLLRADSLLVSTYGKLRSGAMSTVSGLASTKYISLSTIGINTENYMDNGKLVINEDKLRAALADDPEAVGALFNKKGTGFSDSGIAVRLHQETKSDISLIREKAGNASDNYDSSLLGKEMIEIDERKDSAYDRLSNYETRLWKQYEAMEQALQKLNSQSSYLMSLLGDSSS